MSGTKDEMTTKMDLQDFSHNFKWKLFIPFIFLTSWTLMFIGPIYFPYGYQIYAFVIIGYAFFKTFVMLPSFIIAIYKMVNYNAISRFKLQSSTISNAPSSQDIQTDSHYYHAIIIPSYKQDLDLLSQTLQVLAGHHTATTHYLVFMGMQAHEPGCQAKAQKLIQKHGKCFKYMGYTKHILREHQSKGKASNVSWCGQHIIQKIQHLKISENDIMVTVLDADSWAPKQYFAEVQQVLKNRPQIKDVSMFCPPQIYTRNNLQVPIFNRVFDILMTMAHLSSMVAFYYSFPLSNYTLSYNLVKRIGFWDTCSDAIGEDFHTCQKCHWKLDQGVQAIPIYIPFNQLSLETGDGYCNDMKARFWQAERHAKGVNDVAYCLHMLFSTRFHFRNFILTILVLEVFLLAAVLPWPLISTGIVYNLFNSDYQHNFPTWLIDIAINLPYFAALLSYIFYQIFKRQGNQRFYHVQNQPLWRVIEYPILFPVILSAYTASFIVASFGALFNQNQYRVAEKHTKNITKQKISDSSTKGPEMQMTNPLLE